MKRKRKKDLKHIDGNDVGRIVNRFFNVFTKFKTRNDHLPLLAGRII